MAYADLTATAAAKRETMSDILGRLDEIEKIAHEIKGRASSLNSRVNGGGEVEGVSDERDLSESGALVPKLNAKTTRIHDLLNTILDRLGNVENGLR